MNMYDIFMDISTNNFDDSNHKIPILGRLDSLNSYDDEKRDEKLGKNGIEEPFLIQDEQKDIIFWSEPIQNDNDYPPLKNNQNENEKVKLSNAQPKFCIDSSTSNNSTKNYSSEQKFLGRKKIFKVISDNFFDQDYSDDCPYQKTKKTMKGDREDENKRKYGPDNIRKRIKTKFHHSLKDYLNSNLISAGSKQLFSYFPQSFISNPTKNENQPILNLTIEEIFYDYFKEEKLKGSDLSNYKQNRRVLDYLKEHKDISVKSGFEKFKKMKYNQIYEEYLQSNLFQRNISELKKTEDKLYIEKYKQIARDYIDFFASKKATKDC